MTDTMLRDRQPVCMSPMSHAMSPTGTHCAGAPQLPLTPSASEEVAEFVPPLRLQRERFTTPLHLSHGYESYDSNSPSIGSPRRGSDEEKDDLEKLDFDDFDSFDIDNGCGFSDDGHSDKGSVHSFKGDTELSELSKESEDNELSGLNENLNHSVHPLWEELSAALSVLYD